MVAELLTRGVGVLDAAGVVGDGEAAEDAGDLVVAANAEVGEGTGVSEAVAEVEVGDAVGDPPIGVMVGVLVLVGDVVIDTLVVGVIVAGASVVVRDERGVEAGVDVTCEAVGEAEVVHPEKEP